MLNWNEYVKKGTIKKSISNLGLIKSLIESAENRIKIISQIKLNEESCAVIFTNFYESLREICEAITILKGYKIYSHEALALFLKKILKEEAIFYKFNKFRIMRNNLHYSGKRINFQEGKKAISEIKKIITKLKSKYKL